MGQEGKNSGQNNGGRGPANTTTQGGQGDQTDNQVHFANKDLAGDLQNLIITVCEPMRELFSIDGSPNMTFINAQGPMNAVNSFLTSLDHFQAEIKDCKKAKCSTETADFALTALSELKSICKDLKAVKDTTEKRPDLKEKLMTNVEKLTSLSNVFGPLVTGTSPLTKNPMGQPSTSSMEGDRVQQAIRSAAEKTKIAQTQLDLAQKRADDAFERDTKLTEQLMAEISKLAEFDAVTASTDKIIEVLKQGLESLAKLKDRWIELTLFFQSIGNMIKHSMGPPLKHLVEDCQKGANGRMTPMLKQMIYGHAYDASKMSFLVNALSSSYLKLSGEFFMPLVSQLGTLMALTDQSEVNQKKDELDDQAKAMQVQLKQTLKEEQAKFQLKFEQRSQELKDSFDALPLGVEEKKQIEHQVQQVKETVTQNYEDFA